LVALRPITAADWHRHAARFIEFERDEFPLELQEDPQDLRQMIQSPTAIVVGAYDARASLDGYVASDRLEQFGEVPGVTADLHWGREDSYYIASVVVAGELRHRGVATRLVRRCLALIAEHGYHRATAHMAVGAAVKLDPAAHILSTHPNWYGTGRVFEYVEFCARGDWP
jgi:ribosomal protein S18 acetylase RimI-like enzyme